MSVSMSCHFTSTHFHLLRVLAGQTERSATREAIFIRGARLCLWTAHPDPAQRHRTHASGIERSAGHFQTSCGEWEAGSSYPKATHLKALIALAVKEQVWAFGHEAEEIRALEGGPPEGAVG